MSDTGKYTNQGTTVTVDGNDYRLRGMGLAWILAEAGDCIRRAHMAEAKDWADETGLEGKDRLEYILAWQDKHPMPEDKDLEDRISEFICSSEGMIFITTRAIQEQLEFDIDDARQFVSDCKPEDLWEIAQVVFGGIIALSKKKASQKPKAKRPRRRKAKA
jgi:hypothetical protein